MMAKEGAKFRRASAIGISTILLIIYQISSCVAANEIAEIERYDVYSELPHLGSYSTIIKLREKRQTPTDLKNQYQSVPQNATTTNTADAAAASAAATANGDAKQSIPPTQGATSVVVPYNASERPLLGVNGTGQRKDVTSTSADKSQLKPTIVSDATKLTAAAAAGGAVEDAAKKPNKDYPKKVLTVAAPPATPTVGGSQSASDEETADEKVIDTVDVPENETLNALLNQHLTINQTTDYHNYYNSTIYVNKLEADQVWSLIKNTSANSMLSQSHRRAMTVELTFDFPFYGHPVRNVTVATGGFLYTGEYVHSWLAATQYIAPLMANFDTSLSNDSFVRLNDNGTAFTVIWENVSLQDKQDVGKFTFSTTLHKNGDIVFTYFSVPILVNAIQDDKHPVKVGLSDAYIIDKVVYFARRKTIYEYHRLNFANSDITNATIIKLTALPNCLSYTDCVSCINHETAFDCAWCPVLNRCSTGTDRKKQEWLHKGCDRAQLTDIALCPTLGQKGNNANQTSSATDNSSADENNANHGHDFHPSTMDDATITPMHAKPVSNEVKASMDDHPQEPKSVGMALGFVLPICFVATALLWVLYAYRNPHTKSGQLLIQYRPSQWWRRGEARYTAATIHM